MIELSAMRGLIAWASVSPARYWWIEPVAGGRIKVAIDEAVAGGMHRSARAYTVPITDDTTADATASAVNNAILRALESWERRYLPENDGNPDHRRPPG